MVKLRHLLRRRRRPAAIPIAGSVVAQAWTDAASRLRSLGPAPSILVLKLDHIGDLVTALPACARLRAAFPQARIDLLCGPYNCALAASSGLFDGIHAFDFFDSLERTPRAADGEDAQRLRGLGLPAFDIAIDLRHDDDTRALLWGIDAAVRVGFAGLSRLWPLDVALPEMEASARASGLLPPVNATTRLVLLVEALSSAFHAAVQGYGGPLGHAASEPGVAAARFPAGYVVLVTGSRLPIKRWTTDGWVQLAQAIVARTGLGVVLMGRAEEAEDSAAIVRALPAGRVLDLTGHVPLDQVPQVVGAARGLVGLDSGLSHMAAALAVPTVVLFSGFAEIRVWAPVGPRAVVLRACVPCAPCFLPALDLCGAGHACMAALSPADVLAALAGVTGIRALDADAAATPASRDPDFAGADLP